MPRRYAGAHRRVYPGFLQLSAFMTMNLSRHVRAHMDLFGHILKGELAKADANRKFYDEYFSVADLPAEFYLETVQQGVPGTSPGARRLYLSQPQGRSARHPQDLAADGGRRARRYLRPGPDHGGAGPVSSIKPFRKKHYVQAGVGHYGVFSGTRWQTQIYPMVRNTILASE